MQNLGIILIGLWYSSKPRKNKRKGSKPFVSFDFAYNHIYSLYTAFVLQLSQVSKLHSASTRRGFALFNMIFSVDLQDQQDCKWQRRLCRELVLDAAVSYLGHRQMLVFLGSCNDGRQVFFPQFVLGLNHMQALTPVLAELCWFQPVFLWK